MTIRYLTDFDGADANPIGSPFSVFPYFDTSGDIRRVSNVALGTGLVRNAVYMPSISAVGSSGYAELTVGSLGIGGGLMGLAICGLNLVDQVAWNFGPDDSGVAYMNRYTPSGYNTLTTAGHSHTPGDRYRLKWEQVGADVVLTAYINDVAIGSPTTDPGFTAGALGGFMLRNTDCEGLLFEFGDFAAASNNAGPLVARRRLKSLTGGGLCN